MLHDAPDASGLELHVPYVPLAGKRTVQFWGAHV